MVGGKPPVSLPGEHYLELQTQKGAQLSLRRFLNVLEEVLAAGPRWEDGPGRDTTRGSLTRCP